MIEQSIYCSVLTAGRKGKLTGLVSNPPYIPSSDIPGLQAEVGRHEPKLALDGGMNGTDHLLHLCEESATALRPGGFFAFEPHRRSPYRRLNSRKSDTSEEELNFLSVCSRRICRMVILANANALNFGSHPLRSLKLCLRLSIKNLSQKIHMDNSQLLGSRGSLIVLEGLDRSGKTSQSAKLVSYLKSEGISVESWRFPDRSTSVGQMISAYLANETQLDDRTIHLLFSANRWEKRSLMESKLRNGTSLVIDRYSYSGVAFSAAKGLDTEWCKAPEVGLIAPDLVIFLDVSPERAAERGGYGTERYEHLEFQRKVAQHYANLQDASWKVIDGCLPVEDVENQIRELALNCLAKCRAGKPLTNLWLTSA
ncbi:hypothetical protein J5N97_008714 [Dioscorea zingiberensis]|uniref:Thymidylate kinase n=1 Tax=Dioscorea zingiberensis TaxID=325984 RepID=A0A9D5CWZ6_9LILI|nr:hypothetical protein J5N97_008714 [Dioscorea zingiberensis]